MIKLNNYDKQIKIHHLTGKDWVRFTEYFVYNTNAIEGSTVQLDEVKNILEKQRVPGNAEEVETEGVAKAVELIRNIKEDLSLELIKKLHRLCFEGSKPFAGQFREVNVVIRNGKGEIVHAGVHVSELHSALKDFIEWYKENKHKFKPLVLASIVHDQFEHIHPFQDGNGRVGRLLLNFILIKNNYPPINIILEDRSEYYQVLQDYSKKQDIKPTIKFLVKQYNKMLKKVTISSKK
jgi:Fic family protein